MGSGFEARKASLLKLLRNAPSGIQFNEHIEADPAELFAHACRMGLEGIVWKRRAPATHQADLAAGSS